MHMPPRAPAALSQWVTWYHLARSFFSVTNPHRLGQPVGGNGVTVETRSVKYKQVFTGSEVSGSKSFFWWGSEEVQPNVTKASATWLLKKFFLISARRRCTFYSRYLNHLTSTAPWTWSPTRSPPCQYSDICSGFYSIWRNYTVKKKNQVALLWHFFTWWFTLNFITQFELCVCGCFCVWVWEEASGNWPPTSLEGTRERSVIQILSVEVCSPKLRKTTTTKKKSASTLPQPNQQHWQ